MGGSDADPPLIFLTLKWEGRAVQKGGSDLPTLPANHTLLAGREKYFKVFFHCFLYYCPDRDHHLCIIRPMNSWFMEVNYDKPMKTSLQQQMQGHRSEKSKDKVWFRLRIFVLMEMIKNPRAQRVICCEGIANENMRQSKLLWQNPIDRKHLDLINETLVVDSTKLKYSLYRTNCMHIAKNVWILSLISY